MKSIQIIYSPLFNLLSSNVSGYQISNFINYPYSSTPHIWRPNADVFETENSWVLATFFDPFFLKEQMFSIDMTRLCLCLYFIMIIVI